MKKWALFLIFGTYICQAATIGSDSAVSVITSQQTMGTGDRVASFVLMKGGFQHSFLSNDAIFDSQFPVSGVIEMNGGRLNLNSDLLLSDPVEIRSIGSIHAHNHVIKTSPLLERIPTLSSEALNSYVIPIVQASPNNNTIQSVDWSAGSNFIAIGTDVAVLNTVLFVYELVGNTLVSRASTSLGTLGGQVNCVRWHPSLSFLAIAKNFVLLGGAQLFVYSFNTGTYALTTASSANPGNNLNAVSWRPSGSHLAVGAVGGTAELTVYAVDGSGNLGASTTVNIAPNRDVQPEALSWSPDGNFLVIGLNANASNPETIVYQFSSSPLSLTQRASVLNNATVHAVDWHPTHTNLVAVGLEGTSGDLLRVYDFNPTGGSLTQVAGISGLGATVNAVHWAPDGTSIALGNTGGFFKTYAFDAAAMQFTAANDVTTAGDVESVRWSPNSSYVAQAVGSTVKIYGAFTDQIEMNGTDAAYTFTDVHMILQGNLALANGFYRFEGSNYIDGQGHVLTIEPTATILIAPGAVFECNNLIIDEPQVGCLDTTGTLVLRDCRVTQHHDAVWPQGNIQIYGHVCWCSDNECSFVYQSNQPFTINKFAQLTFEEWMTFEYAPTQSSADRIQLIDETAILSLNNSEIINKNQMLLLKNGQFRIFGDAVIDSTQATHELQIGTGLSQEDCFFELAKGAMLFIANGVLRYKNVSPSNIYANRLAILNMGSLTQLILEEDFNIDPGRVIFEANTTLATSSGKKLKGSIVSKGPLARSIL